jgi:tRNA(Leu) C34 or U34 (ribose-2'-O)-methylase TrmL
MKTELTQPRQNFGKGFCGIGVFKPKSKENIGTLIRSAKMFNADFVFMIGERYTSQCSAVKLDEKIPVFYFKDFASFCEAMPPVEKFTCIELTNNSKPLSSYKHNRKGIYILGSEDNGLPKEILESDRCEFIEIEGNSSLNVAVAGSIVLYDRQIKN